MVLEPEGRWRLDITFIEQGDVYFFYKPKKDVHEVREWEDVGRFYFVLSAHNQPPRYIVMGAKRMPTFTDGDQTAWGFVQMVGGKGFETYRNPTEYRKKTSSRPVGEGIYSIVSHGNHTHFLYALELPHTLGDVQKAFNITKEANYIVSNRPPSVSPKSIEEPFSNFTPAMSAYLNERGTELLLIGVGADVGRLGIAANIESETLKTADIFSKLKLDAQTHRVDTLISGNWQ